MSDMKRDKPRKPVLIRYRDVSLTKEAHQLLRVEKKKQDKSMMQIVDNLIKQAYAIQ